MTVRPAAPRALMIAALLLSSASPVVAQSRPGRAAPVAETACPAGAYSVVTAPDGTSVTVIFNDFSARTGEAGGSARTRCRIQVPLAMAAGRSVGLTSVDYRGYAMLGRRQAAELDVAYEFGRGNRAPHFHRRIQGAQDSDFAFTDRLPPGQLRRVGCEGATPVLSIDAALALSGNGQTGAALVALDSADQTSGGALRYRFDIRPC